MLLYLGNGVFTTRWFLGTTADKTKKTVDKTIFDRGEDLVQADKRDGELLHI